MQSNAINRGASLQIFDILRTMMTFSTILTSFQSSGLFWTRTKGNGWRNWKDSKIGRGNQSVEIGGGKFVQGSPEGKSQFVIISHTHTHKKFSPKCQDLIQLVHICALLYHLSFWPVLSQVPSVIVEQVKCCRGHWASVKSWNICLQQFGKHPLLPTLKLLSRDFDKIET